MERFCREDFSRVSLINRRLSRQDARGGGNSNSARRAFLQQAEAAFTAGVIRCRARRDRLLDFENTNAGFMQLFRIDDPRHAPKQRRSRSRKMVPRFRTTSPAARVRVDFREMSSNHLSREAPRDSIPDKTTRFEVRRCCREHDPGLCVESGDPRLNGN